MLTLADFHNYQDKALEHSMQHYNSMLWLFLGAGKCWGLDTELLLHNDGVIKVQDIKQGDKLAHPDGGYQTVLSTTVGRDEMYRVESSSRYKNKFEPFTCNGDHILVFKQNGTFYKNKYGEDAQLTVKEFIKLKDHQKINRYKMYRSKINYPKRSVLIDPYVLGVWLGDGYKNTSAICLHTDDAAHIKPHLDKEADKYGLPCRIEDQKGYCESYHYTHGRQHYGKPTWRNHLIEYNLLHNKHIPDEYVYNSKKVRLELLAGLLDTDGHLYHDNCFEIAQKLKPIADKIRQICWSLGLNATMSEKIVNEVSYWRINISGNTDIIPTKVPRKTATKRKQAKKSNRYAINVVPIGVDNYYGFTLDGDGLCMLKDCTVTHNTIASLTTVVNRMDAFQVHGTLVIAPLRVSQSVWEPEAKKWAHTQHLTFNFIHGEECEKIRALNVPADIYVINYEGLMWLSEHLTEHYLKRGKRPPFNMMIADEVTKLKNAQSLRHEALRTFLLQIPYRMGLTATPASNGYKDLFGQYLAIDGGERLGMVEKDFKETFFNKCGYMNKDIELRNDSKDKILDQIADITLQMNEKDYLELPPVTYNDVYVPMEGRPRQQYEKMERDLFIELDSGQNVEIANAAGLTNKCLQFASGAVYLNPGEPEWAQVHKLKLDALDDIIEESGHNPILCLHEFQHDRHRIMKKYPHAEYIKSGMPKTQVTDIINRWNAGLIELLIGHPASIGYGLNLQGAYGSMICWFGLPWSLELYLQANARIARQGVQHHVVITRLLMQFTMDEAVAIALRNKAETENDLRQSVADYRKIKLGLLDL